MPGGIDGYQLATAVLELPPELKILLTSGFTKTLAELKGVDDLYIAKLNRKLLSKPYNKSELLLAVRQLIDGEEIAR